MRNTSTFESWERRERRETRHTPVPRASAEARKVAEILGLAGIRLNGPEPWDMQVHNPDFFRRVLAEGSIGLGESYMDGWWDAAALDEFFARVRRADLYKAVRDAKTAWLVAQSRVLNLQSQSRARKVAHAHYDLGNDLYRAMLDRRMQYTCAY